ncbi:MAG: tRNA (cytidine(34)-2'-O)-methyltransferase [Gammaproteobacteria bacterium]|nr:tRNA (cytidine(34)-2'-O)-methyltransferase [Gammaproteobacteria bacterium]
MLHIVLFEPEIPPNTGNIIRLCANTGAKLHLIEPLSFVLDDKKMRRAGLDYVEWAEVTLHKNFDSALSSIAYNNIYAISTKGKNFYHNINFQPNDILLFGPESRGLPKDVLAYIDQINQNNIIRIPMAPNSRSLNLSNSVAVILYEVLRQNDFSGLI